MKIVFVANFGMGFYKFRKEIAETLVNDGHDVYILAPRDEYSDLLEKLGCEVIHTSVDRRGLNPVKDIRLLVSYFKILKRIKPDYIYTYTIKPNIYAGLVARILKIPYSATVTGLGTALKNKNFVSTILHQMYRVSLKKANSVFFQNKENANHFRKKNLYKGNINLVPGSGVNLKEYSVLKYPTEQEKINFLYIGRLMKAKGIDELLEVSKHFLTHYPNVRFHIVGFAEKDYKNLDANSYPNVIFYGEQKNVKTYLEHAHALILPSHHEGLANVLLEAAASGRPVLASKIPGCVETFDDGKSGFSFEIKDTSSMIVALNNFLALSHEEKIGMGISGRRKIEQEFDRNIVIAEYKKEIRTVRKYANEY